MIYKVSYVVRDGSQAGGIKNEQERPHIGTIVRIGPNQFEVVEVHEVMPARGDFLYLHATIEPIQSAKQ
jgi:hypothetical protein